MCKKNDLFWWISNVNILSNNIRPEQANELIKIMAANNLKTLCGLGTDKTELDLSCKGLSAGCAVLVANEVKNNAALEKLIFGGSGEVYDDSTWVSASPVALEVGMTEADLSNKNLGTGGAIIVGAWISHKDNGAMVKLDMSNNGIIGGTENAKAAGKALSNMLAVNTMLQELNISNNASYSNSDSESFVMEFAVGLGANGAMVKFDMSDNCLYAEGGKALAEALKGNQVMTELNIASNDLGEDMEDNPDMSGVIAIGNAIPTMGALTSLDISDNKLFTTRKLRNTTLKLGDKTTFEGVEWTVVSAPDSNGDFDAAQMGGVIALANAIKTNGALTHLNIDHDECTPYLIRTIIFECVAGCRLWPFIHLHNYTKKKSVEIKEINALAEAFCMNALSGRAGTCSSNVSHPLRIRWLFRIVVDHLL
jgi:hypothetical protein